MIALLCCSLVVALNMVDGVIMEQVVQHSRASHGNFVILSTLWSILDEEGAAVPPCSSMYATTSTLLRKEVSTLYGYFILRFRCERVVCSKDICKGCESYECEWYDKAHLTDLDKYNFPVLCTFANEVVSPDMPEKEEFSRSQYCNKPVPKLFLSCFTPSYGTVTGNYMRISRN